MGAYEGVRGEAVDQPVWFGSDGGDAARRLLGSITTTRSGTRSPGQPFPGNIIPREMLSPTSLSLLQYYPDGEPCRHRQQPAGAERQQRQRGSGAGEGRPESRQQDSAQRPLQLARQFQRQRVQRRDSRHGGHAAAREQELVVLLHAHAAAEPAERLPDRLSPHRLRHRESLLCRAGRRTPGPASAFRASTATPGTETPACRASTSATSAASPPAARTGSSSTRPSRCRTCSSYNRGSHNIALGLRPAAHGDRPPGGERPARALRLHRRHQRLLGCRLHARAAAHRDPADRSDPGPRRRLAQRVLHQRYLAGRRATSR